METELGKVDRIHQDVKNQKVRQIPVTVQAPSGYSAQFYRDNSKICYTITYDNSYKVEYESVKTNRHQVA